MMFLLVSVKNLESLSPTADNILLKLPHLPGAAPHLLGFVPKRNIKKIHALFYFVKLVHKFYSGPTLKN